MVTRTCGAVLSINWPCVRLRTLQVERTWAYKNGFGRSICDART
jgi:hypothetical protein